MVIWNVLEDLRRRENARRGYREVKTPLIFEKALWVTSGHWEKFRENMFFIRQESEDQLFGLKPMNCPGHCLVYDSRLHSYRDLPVRLAEAGTLHRNEPSGTLHGLLRVRHVTQDDGHTFCTPEQIEDEVFLCLDHAFYLYSLLDLSMHVELSLRPENKLGSDADWDTAEEALRNALRKREVEFVEMPGEGAFYGPKIDIHMEDSLGRRWQLGTVQLDFQMPQRFGLTYQTRDNEQRTPAMIHRALFGSLERFIGILIEHYGGAFPFWLAPVQVCVLPVGRDHVEKARAIAAQIPYRVELDESDETVGKRIRNAELEKVPFTLVVGERESEESLAIRERGGEQSQKSLSAFVSDLASL
jgi:threonyl-tRNA synthetase